MGASVAIACLLLGRPLLGGKPAVDTLLTEEFSLSFRKAHRITVTAAGSFFVTDEEANGVFLFPGIGAHPRVIGGFGWGETTFDKPSGIATDGVNIYVADYGNHRIQRYDRLLNFVSTLSTRDTSLERARFGFPLGVALSRHGDLFVLDGENSRIVKFNSRSRFERAFGDVESAYRLKRPLDVLVTRDDRVLVLESDRVVEFDFSGNYVRFLGAGEIADAQGFSDAHEGFVVAEPAAVLWFDLSGVLRTRTRAGETVSQNALSRFCDVAVWGAKLFLLTEDSLHIFKLETAPP